MKKEVMEAMEAAKQDFIVRLMKQEQEFVAQASKLEERGDYENALHYAVDVRKVQKKRLEIENSDAVQVVTKDEDAFEFFLDCVKHYVSNRMKVIYRQLFLTAMRPWEAIKEELNDALLDIELVVSDLMQFKERYPTPIQLYLNQLRTIPIEVEAVLKEIA